jgi:hypothetical protein
MVYGTELGITRRTKQLVFLAMFCKSKAGAFVDDGNEGPMSN